MATLYIVGLQFLYRKGMGMRNGVSDAVFVFCWANLEGCGKLTTKRFFFFGHEKCFEVGLLETVGIWNLMVASLQSTLCENILP